MGASSVRRNLFSSNLSKRSGPTLPPIQGGSNSNTSANASNLQSPTHTTSSADTIPLNNGNSATNPTERTNDTGDIVVKDKNGAYKLDIPVLPLGNGDDEDDMDTIEDIQNGGRVIDPTGAGETILCGKEKERFENSLIEMMCRNRNRQSGAIPIEVYSLIFQSLEQKAASLDEDNWMYETEVEPRV